MLDPQVPWEVSALGGRKASCQVCIGLAPSRRGWDSCLLGFPRPGTNSFVICMSTGPPLGRTPLAIVSLWEEVVGPCHRPYWGCFCVK